MKTILTIETLNLVIRLFDGIKDKNGIDYYLHCLGVADLVEDPTEDEYIIALLHDSIEDGVISEDELKNLGYSEYIISCVKKLCRKHELSYINWIKSLVDDGDVSVLKVKLADNRHNSLPERINSLPEEQRSIIKRYEKSIEIISSALDGMKFKP